MALASVAEAFHFEYELTYLAGPSAQSMLFCLSWHFSHLYTVESEPEAEPLKLHCVKQRALDSVPSWSWLSTPVYVNFDLGLESYYDPYDSYDSIIFMAKLI